MKSVLALSQSDYMASEEALNTILEIDSTNADAWYNLGVTWRGSGSDEKAFNAFQQALRLDGPADTHYYLGLFYDMKGDQELALRHYRWRVAKHLEPIEEDFFANAARERIRMIQTGHSRLGVKLPQWSAQQDSVDADSSGYQPAFPEPVSE